MWRGKSDPAMLMILVRPIARDEAGARGADLGTRWTIQRAKAFQDPFYAMKSSDPAAVARIPKAACWIDWQVMSLSGHGP